jgi:hypothetical protein
MSNATPPLTAATERAGVKPVVVESKPKKSAQSRRMVVDEPDLIAAK